MEVEGCEGEGREKKNPLQISDLQGIVNFLGVPRPAFEIIKVGEIWVKRKTQKNAAI